MDVSAFPGVTVGSVPEVNERLVNVLKLQERSLTSLRRGPEKRMWIVVAAEQTFSSNAAVCVSSGPENCFITQRIEIVCQKTNF